jgi:hypothetical protein
LAKQSDHFLYQRNTQADLRVGFFMPVSFSFGQNVYQISTNICPGIGTAQMLSHDSPFTPPALVNHSKSRLRLLIICLGVLAASCGGGGGDGGSNSTAISNPWLSKVQVNVVGSNSANELSGIQVPDLSDCQVANPAQANEVPVCVDDGPIDPATAQSARSVNRPFVTVRLCKPGDTTQCVNVNHMLVDTGSTGIRVSVPALPSRINLPAVTTRAGAPVAECMHFISGWTWGSLNRADVYIGGLVARNMPIQMMESAPTNPTLGGHGGGAFPKVPPECSEADINANVGSVGTIRANGIIGVGVWPNDALINYDQYFVCASGVCTVTNDLDPSQRPTHPVLHLPNYRGGVSLKMAAISRSGTLNATGTLTFGVTSVPPGASQLVLNEFGLFTTTAINGQIYPYSYIDSGTVGMFFDLETPAIPECTRALGLYCPSTSLRMAANQSDADGNNHYVSFEVPNLEDLLINSRIAPTALNNLTGPTYDSYNLNLPQRFAWGFPFFYGRTVYTLLAGTTLGGEHGTVAYTSP